MKKIYKITEQEESAISEYLDEHEEFCVKHASDELGISETAIREEAKERGFRLLNDYGDISLSYGNAV